MVVTRGVLVSQLSEWARVWVSQSVSQSVSARSRERRLYHPNMRHQDIEYGCGPTSTSTRSRTRLLSVDSQDDHRQGQLLWSQGSVHRLSLFRGKRRHGALQAQRNPVQPCQALAYHCILESTTAGSSVVDEWPQGWIENGDFPNGCQFKADDASMVEICACRGMMPHGRTCTTGRLYSHCYSYDYQVESCRRWLGLQ